MVVQPDIEKVWWNIQAYVMTPATSERTDRRTDRRNCRGIQVSVRWKSYPGSVLCCKECITEDAVHVVLHERKLSASLTLTKLRC